MLPSGSASNTQIPASPRALLAWRLGPRRVRRLVGKNLTTAVSPKDVRFNQLEASTGQRIRQKRVSSGTGEGVPYDDIVKGFEIGPDKYVTLTSDELESVDPKATRSIDVEDFVDLDQIDPLYYERAYYLVPDTGGAKAYALLRDAMRET